MKIQFLMALFLFGWCGPVLSQNCPYGIPSAGNPACIPPSSSNSQASATSQVKWATRWGAVAVDETVNQGGIGTVAGLQSKRKAEKAALAQCRVTGGAEGCKIFAIYRNQCAVFVWGAEKFNIASAPSIEQATAIAMSKCKSETTNCRIYYKECSLPVRVQ